MGKRGLALLTAALLAVALLAGCGKAAEENLEERVPELLEQEVLFEGIYRGGGLPTVPNAPYEPDEHYQCFVPVTDENYPSVEALKAATEEVFTAEYAQENFYLWAFEGDAPRYKDMDGRLCMDIGQGGGLDKTWDTASWEILSEDEETVEITADYLNYGSVRTAELTLVKTEEGLRIGAMRG